jgi:hypothetical protein
METDTWQVVLAASLAVNAVLGLGYRVLRLTRGGPMSDVVGQAILGLVLLGLALGAYAGARAATLGGLFYGILFGAVVMPIWTLAVLIPMTPGPLDYAFTIAYWSLLALIVVAAIAAP